MQIKFTDCEKKLSDNDLKKVEASLSISLSETIKQHYLKFNGGKPNKTVWIDSTGEYDYLEVRDFIPMLYSADFEDDPDYTLDGRTKDEWGKQSLPKNLVEFSMDWGGNYFCFDYISGKIFYFVRDVWSDNLNYEQNLKVNSRLIANSFSEFIDGLIENDDDY